MNGIIEHFYSPLEESFIHDENLNAQGDPETRINSKITGWSFGARIEYGLHLMTLDFLKFGLTKVPSEPLILIHVEISIKARA